MTHANRVTRCAEHPKVGPLLLVYNPIREWNVLKLNRCIPRAVLYFGVIASVILFKFSLFTGSRLEPEQDGGIIYYAIIDNIHKFSSLDFTQWTNRKIFYPHDNTLAYTEHYYVHSLIGFPYYILTRDPMETYDFIFFVQLMLGAKLKKFRHRFCWNYLLGSLTTTFGDSEGDSQQTTATILSCICTIPNGH